MNQKDFKTRMAHEALIILGVLALLSVICRLWPILLLILLGIFIAAFSARIKPGHPKVNKKVI